MKPVEIRKLSVIEIKKKIEESRKDYMLLRFQAVSGQLTDTTKITNIKRLIARLETISHEKQLGMKVEGDA